MPSTQDKACSTSEDHSDPNGLAVATVTTTATIESQKDLRYMSGIGNLGRHPGDDVINDNLGNNDALNGDDDDDLSSLGDLPENYNESDAAGRPRNGTVGGKVSRRFKKKKKSASFRSPECHAGGGFGDTMHSTDMCSEEASEVGRLKRQTKQISVIRCLTITSLLTVAAVVANVAYIIALFGEERNREASFQRYAQDILHDNFESRLVQSVWAADTLAQQLQPMSDNNNGGHHWPEVTLANFDSLAHGIQELAFHPWTVSFSPILKSIEEMEEWEDYAAQYNESSRSFAATSGNSISLPTKYHDTTQATYRHGIFGIHNGSTFHHDPTKPPVLAAPVWQVSPYHAETTGQTILFDQMTEEIRHRAISRLVETKHFVLSEPLYHVTDDSIHNQTYTTPAILLYFPIFDDVPTADNDKKSQKQEVVGALLLETELRTFLKYRTAALSTKEFNSMRDKLVESDVVSDEPLAVVVSHTCGSSYTYEIVGTQVTFLGEGDLHVKVRDAYELNLQANITFDEFESLLEKQQNSLDGLYGSGEDNVGNAATIAAAANDEAMMEDHLKHGKSATRCGDAIAGSYQINVYSTEAFRDSYLTGRPVYIELGIAMMFLFTSGVLMCYDCLLERRQKKVLAEATEANLLLHAHYPAGVRARLLANAEATARKDEERRHSGHRGGHRNNTESEMLLETPRLRLKGFLKSAIVQDQGSPSDRKSTGNALPSSGIGAETEPIADLFPSVSVMFADIQGFTAWTSEREPSQIFTLLETVYGGMDKVARALGVFKVETVGDSYVAAAGLPEPCKNGQHHVVVISRFAHHSMLRVNELTSALETTLGPGTGDLKMRFGIHSGSVTAGVLRGEKTHFQLFGDTVNTASRMESNGIPNRIQLSEESAQLLIEQGKSHWVEERPDTVAIKGKGELKTYFLVQAQHHRHGQEVDPRKSKTGRGSSMMEGFTPFSAESIELTIQKAAQSALNQAELEEMRRSQFHVKQERSIEWNVEVLMRLLGDVLAEREELAALANTRRGRRRSQLRSSSLERLESWRQPPGSSILDEVRDFVVLPDFNHAHASSSDGKDNTHLISNQVRMELRDYVAQIAVSYHRENPFHNFEHASHVCMSANKLLKRITRPDDYYQKLATLSSAQRDNRKAGADLHDFTYGISSDALTRFAVVFSALIHDVGHTGVPNSQLSLELPEISARYRHQSLAEQRSIDIAWELLESPCYDNLRASIFATPEERDRFRQWIVNTIIATDIFDKEHSSRRKERWSLAFEETSCPTELDEHFSGHSRLSRGSRGDEELLHRRATVVVEHLIQASDVAHTMQHWHVYQKWNTNLFEEMYLAYLNGRSQTDPSISWYKGELWFFDNYIIPLAQKLQICGVFGVSGDEYLNYALGNRAEFQRKGEKLVADMVERVKATHQDASGEGTSSLAHMA